MLSLYPCPVQAWDTLPLMLSVARLTVSTLKVLSWGWAPAKGLRAQKPEHLFLLKKKDHFYYTSFISELINFNENLHDYSIKILSKQ